MDFFNTPYFRTNKHILRICGLWPYQSHLKSMSNYLISTITIFSMVFSMAAGIYSQVNHEPLIILETVIALFYCGGALIILTILYSKRHVIKKRYERIAVDWIKLADDTERKIMGTFLLEARSAIFVSIGCGIPAFLLFVCITFLPRIFSKQSLDQCLRSFPYYLRPMVINEKTCDLQMCVHFSVAIIFASFAFLSISATYITSVKHVCALYSIARHRLQNAEVHSENIGPLEESIKDTSIIPSLIKVIDIHKKALRGIQRIEKHFSFGFFFLEIGVLAFLAVLMFEIKYHGGNVNELLRFSPILLIAIIYVFFINWCGEQVIQSCYDLRIAAYNIDWYRISSRVRIFVLMIMRRTAKPYHLTAGTVMMLSIENFATIIKTSWSFGMLLLTTQKQGRNKGANFLEY